MFIYSRTFYVYAYLRDDGTPYYIGKGFGRRAYEKHRHVPVPKNHSLIVLMETNLSEIGAFALERRYIGWYGRKDLGTGILLNRTDGGDGASGRPSTRKGKRIGPPSPEHRAAISAAKKGTKPSPATLAAISKSIKGKRQSPEHIAKRTASLKGISVSKIKCPRCGKIGGIGAMKRWHFDACHHDLF